MLSFFGVGPGCASTATAPPPPSPSPRQKTTAEPGPLAPTAAPAPPADPGAPPTASAAAEAPDPPPAEPVLETRWDDHYPKAGAVVVADWLAAHHTTSKVVGKECWDLGNRVGAPAASGLLCVVSAARPPRVQARIFRLEGGRMRAVWEGPVATWTNWLELTPLLAEDGTLTVHERRPFACSAALSEYRAKEDAGVPMDWGGVLREGCALPGTYRYDGKKYVKDGVSAAPPPGF